jgi:predicted transcriptional regulator
MSTTTIRLPVELKARVADAARRSGTTPHGFILAAIAEKTDADQRRAEFEQMAAARYDGIVASDRTIPWGEMRQYMQARTAGRKAKRPTARKLSR